MLEILYQDQDLVAINKPHGLLVHRTKIARDASEFSIQLLRDQKLIHKNETFYNCPLISQNKNYSQWPTFKNIVLANKK